MAILIMECPCCGSKYELGRNLDVRKETEADRIRAMTDEELAKYLAWLGDDQACYQWEMYDDAIRITEWLNLLRRECE